jgi:hypothetical protein
MYPKVRMDCFESLAQPPEGDTDLAQVKSKLGSHMTLSGGIDQKAFSAQGLGSGSGAEGGGGP